MNKEIKKDMNIHFFQNVKTVKPKFSKGRVMPLSRAKSEQSQINVRVKSEQSRSKFVAKSEHIRCDVAANSLRSRSKVTQMSDRSQTIVREESRSKF